MSPTPFVVEDSSLNGRAPDRATTEPLPPNWTVSPLATLAGTIGGRKQWTYPWTETPLCTPTCMPVRTVPTYDHQRWECVPVSWAWITTTQSSVVRPVRHPSPSASLPKPPLPSLASAAQNAREGSRPHHRRLENRSTSPRPPESTCTPHGTCGKCSSPASTSPPTPSQDADPVKGSQDQQSIRVRQPPRKGGSGDGMGGCETSYDTVG